MSQDNGILQTVSKQDAEELSITETKRTLLLNKVGYMDKGTGQHQSNEVFGKDGICPTIPSVSYKEPLKIVDKDKNGT